MEALLAIDCACHFDGCDFATINSSKRRCKTNPSGGFFANGDFVMFQNIPRRFRNYLLLIFIQGERLHLGAGSDEITDHANCEGERIGTYSSRRSLFRSVGPVGVSGSGGFSGLITS